MTAERKRKRSTDTSDANNGLRRGGSVFVASNRCLAVSGCKGISEYTLSSVRLMLREADLTVKGSGLTVHTYCGDEIEVRGRIDAVFFGNSFEEEDNKC